MKVVRGYHHHDGSIGVLAMFEVGTDFTSRTTEFKMFADGVLMSLAFWIRDYKVGPEETPCVFNEETAMGAPWIGDGDFESVADAFKAATKQFREPIRLLGFQNLQA